ncbi:hypothetical protein N9250_02810 [bacterium]|nr:hypothetical protein [bacterium]
MSEGTNLYQPMMVQSRSALDINGRLSQETTTQETTPTKVTPETHCRPRW